MRSRLGRRTLVFPADCTALAVSRVYPGQATNGLDTPIVSTGTRFVVLSDTVEPPLPVAYPEDTPLQDPAWRGSSTLSATVPWGLHAGAHTLTVDDPDGQPGSPPNTLTITQGIWGWTSAGP